MKAYQIAVALKDLCEVAVVGDRAAAKAIGESMPAEAKAVGQQIWVAIRSQVARDEIADIASGLRAHLEKERDSG